MKKPDFAEIHARVRTLQSGKRFAHTEGVVKEAEYIAKACGFSTEFVEKARVAALLHDITKNLTDEEQEKLFLKYAIDIPSGPATMHEKTGAHFARELFGAEAVDEEIFSAISSCFSLSAYNPFDNAFEYNFIADSGVFISWERESRSIFLSF